MAALYSSSLQRSQEMSGMSLYDSTAATLALAAITAGDVADYLHRRFH